MDLHRAASDPSPDQELWNAIRNRTHAIAFPRYREFLSRVLRWDESQGQPAAVERGMADLGSDLYGVGAYQTLKLATEIFLLLECGVRPKPGIREGNAADQFNERPRQMDSVPEQMQARLREYLGNPPQLAYLMQAVRTAFPEYDEQVQNGNRVLTADIHEACPIDLIWNYWLEEGMLMQTINAISFRLQNMSGFGDRDPLAALEIEPLRPLNNLFWGYIRDEANRVSVKRRAYEYLHQYGLVLYGKGDPGLRPSDNRSSFLEAFHNLLYWSSVFFKEESQTKVITDGLPLLNSFQQVYTVLAEGAGNQYGDLPWTARVEFLLAEYMLARPEVRDFLRSDAVATYPEAWMAQVGGMKTLQGWPEVSVAQFRDLAAYGEQLLLSIRFRDRNHLNEADTAKNWARYWRPEIQGYLHAYHLATGVDLTSPGTIDTGTPSVDRIGE